MERIVNGCHRSSAPTGEPDGSSVAGAEFRLCRIEARLDSAESRLRRMEAQLTAIAEQLADAPTKRMVLVGTAAAAVSATILALAIHRLLG